VEKGDWRKKKGGRNKVTQALCVCGCVREQPAPGPSPFHYNLSMAT